MPTQWCDPPDAITLAADAVHVWRVPLSAQLERLAALEASLDVDERARAERLRTPEHRDAFIVGRGELRAILACYTGTPAGYLRFRYGRRGKPALADGTDAGDLRFNIAHSGELALFAVSRGREVGVDLERVARRDEAALAERFFTRGEITALGALPPRARREAFYACWTRKEAYLKAKGDGLSTSMDWVEVSIGPGELAALVRVEGDPLEAGRWSLATLDVAEDHQAALCVEGRGWSLTCWRRA